MKRIPIATTLLALVFSTGLWAHHAAQGIVSDEIWNMIDANLEAVDSPHLNIDFDDVMASMRVETDEAGNLYLVTDITAYVDEVADYMAVIDALMVGIAEPVLDESSQVPSGNTMSERASTAFFTVDYVFVPSEDPEAEDVLDYAVISLWEPIGNGNSQADVGSDAPGKRAGG